ncbi:MAG TPA: hypothetical protein VF211_02910 [Burkholderiales bacterium]
MASPIDSAREKAKHAAQSQKDAAAANLGEMADALRGAAGQMNEQNQATIGRAAERAAGALQKMSEKLRAQDVDGLVREAEDFARAQPLAFFGLALAAGFLGARYLKSSQTRP